MATSPLRRIGDWVTGKIATHLDEDAVLLFWVLRRLRVVPRTRTFAMVVRDTDVREVLARRDVFTVESYATRIPSVLGAAFVLGLDDVAEHKRERDLLESAFRADDRPRLAALVEHAARDRVAAAGTHGTIDVVADLVDPVLDEVAGHYLGIARPAPGALVNWSRQVFREVFINLEDNRAVRREALTGARELGTHFTAAMANQRGVGAIGDSPAADVLGRLLQAQRQTRSELTESDIRRNLIGLAVAWIPNTSKAAALAMDQLLRRPRQLAGARQAARRGDVDRLGAYLFEALRFRPQSVGQLRQCTRDFTLASGATIRSGAMVFAVIKSAMMDADAMEAPREFRLDRPWGEYLHFGYGFHTCLGEHLTRAVIPAVLKPLLEGSELRRAPGRPGRLSWKGPYPSGLSVQLTR